MVKYITSESVTEGHPDKLCDVISDSLLDAYLQKDGHSRVAIECMVSKNLLVIAGEVTSSAQIDIEQVARKVIISCGYDEEEKGINGNTCRIIINLQKQSTEIGAAVTGALDGRKKGFQILGAGDQGLMYGYATNETDTFLPPTLYYAQKLAKRLSEVRKDKILPYLRPDGKTQVTIKCDNYGKIEAINSLVVSAQHDETVTQEQLKVDILREVIQPIIPENLLSFDTKIHINPSGSFTHGGPMTDTGLTGRKIIVDTYGGVVPHGGGAFSGKDATKVDRSAAYMARYVAKQIVAARLADKCLVSLSYAIGIAKPIAVTIDCYGTAKVDEKTLEEAIMVLFDFTPQGIINQLNLCQPIYSQTSCYGHFKSEKNQLPWEKMNRVIELKELFN